MKLASWAVIGVAACGPGLARPDTKVASRNALVAAANDPAALERMMHGSVIVGGIAFADAGCAKDFGAAQVVPPDRTHGLAQCLAGLHLEISPREDAIGDVLVVTYAPGYELEARVVQEHDGPRLTWIGYEARYEDEPLLPTITAPLLESLRAAGAPDGPLPPGVVTKLEPDPETHDVHAWVKVCIDGDGNVASADGRGATSAEASEAFAAAARTWKFRPFASPACAMVRMSEPHDPTPEKLPMPAPPSRNKKHPLVITNAKVIEAKRVHGQTLIMPDERTKREIAASDVEHVIGAMRLCLDETGHPESILPLRSTGFASYDRAIIATMNTWVYSPFLVDNQPYPVCTAVTFNYTQRSR